MSEVPRETYEFTKNIPFSEHLGIKVDALEKGVARLSMLIRPEFMTSWGTAHGGVIMSLLDVARHHHRPQHLVHRRRDGRATLRRRARAARWA